MKKLSVLLLSVIGIASLYSCKDDKVNPTVVGYWKGTLNNVPADPFSMLYRSDGTVRFYYGADSATAGKGYGTYTVSDSVRASYVLSGSLDQYSTAGKLNDKGNELVGTYGAGTATTGGGTFKLSKQ